MSQKYSFPREEKAVELFRQKYPDIIIHEDEVSGYYVDAPPADYRIARYIYDVIDIRSGYAAFTKCDSTRPFLYKKDHRYFITVLHSVFGEWEEMIKRQKIFV